mgnify:CR=1 FL=1
MAASFQLVVEVPFAIVRVTACKVVLRILSALVSSGPVFKGSSSHTRKGRREGAGE